MRLYSYVTKEIQKRMRNPMIPKTNGYLIRALNQFASLTAGLIFKLCSRL